MNEDPELRLGPLQVGALGADVAVAKGFVDAGPGLGAPAVPRRGRYPWSETSTASYTALAVLPSHVNVRPCWIAINAMMQGSEE
jgi:hypothetical protein